MVLSESQRIAVESNAKYVLIVAGAGSGKTRVLTERMLRSIQNLPPGKKAIGITFSNKAANEMMDRLSARVGMDELSSKAFVGTLHSFFMEFVNERGMLIGLPNNVQICSNDFDRKSVLLAAIRDTIPWRLTLDPNQNEALLHKFLDDISAQKQKLCEPSAFATSNPEFYHVYTAYDEGLLSQGMIDFDDILRYSYRILRDVPNITNLYRRIYNVIFIDEGQDLNFAQYELIKMLAGDKMGITIVGDPKQAIYGFNGSSSEYMMRRFVNDYHPFQCEISENYRSSKRVIEAARKLEPDYTPNLNLPIEGDFKVYRANDPNDEAEWVYERFAELCRVGDKDLEEGTLKPESCAVIARNRYAFRELQTCFDKHGVKYTEKAQSSKELLAESNQISIFNLGLSLLINPLDKIHFSALNDRLRALQLSTITSLNDLALSQDKLLSSISNSLKLAYNEGFDTHLDYAIAALRNYFFSSSADSEENMIIEDDLLSLEKLYRVFLRRSSPDNRTLKQFMLDVALGKLSEQTIEGVTFTTVHMSKGLEYDVVFVIGATDGGFPDYRAVREFNNGNIIPMEEEKHDMFVAITRAKRICYLTYPAIRKSKFGKAIYQKPSRFIEIINKGSNQ